MSWQYADYESQSTDAAKRARLELHIGEVAGEIGPDTAMAGRSRSHAALVSYLQSLQARLKELQADTASVDTTSARARSGFTRGRPI